MTNECWLKQKERLINRFGEKNFSKEFSLLCAIECQPIADVDFVDIVNHMIGSRPAHKPPLLHDFRDARLAKERKKFERDVFGAMKAMDTPWSGGLQSYLAREFPGCKTLNEAVEVRRLQIQVAKAKDPAYDPMEDPKWK